MNKSREVLSLYRELFRYAKLLPKAKREEAFIEARTTFHSNKTETDPQRIEDLIKAGNSKLSYLKMITPRKRGSSDAGKFIYANGKWIKESEVEIPRDAKNNVHLNDPQWGSLMKKHYSLLDKQKKLGL